MTKINTIKTVRLAVLTLVGTFLFGGVAQAADVDITNAKIFRIGIDPRFQGPMVQLVDLDPTPRWSGIRQFYLSPVLGNGGLATMLTAFSLDSPVFVRIVDDAAESSLITIIFVNAPTP